MTQGRQDSRGDGDASGGFDYTQTATVPLPLRRNDDGDDHDHENDDDDDIERNSLIRNNALESQQLAFNNNNAPTASSRSPLQSSQPVPFLSNDHVKITTATSPPPSLQRQPGQRRGLSLWPMRDFFCSPFKTQEAREELRRQVVAEFMGSFILIFLGLGSVMSAEITGSLEGLFQVAAVWCFAVTTAIATVGPISGAHINPAISLAFVILRPGPHFDWPKFLPYVIAQVLGSTFAAGVNYYIYGTEITDFEVQHGIIRSSDNALATAGCFGSYYTFPVTMSRAFFTEVIGTAFLAGVVFALTHPDNDTTKRNVYVAPFIGICVGALVCCLAPLTGASMNPARDLGPRFVAYFAGWTTLAFRQWWLYMIAPCMGAPLGAFVADQILFNGYDDPTTSATGPTTAIEHHYHEQ